MTSPSGTPADQRRQQILDGVLSLLSREGMTALSMRHVAKEADVSLRLFQYYFQSKANLLNKALLYLSGLRHERWQARLFSMPDRASIRAYLEAFVLESLPLTEESKLYHMMWMSYAVLALTDKSLASEPFIEGPSHVERAMIARLMEARKLGEVPQDRDPAYEAARLIGLSQGFAHSILSGQTSGEAAVTLMQAHIDDILEPRLEPA